jgi:23S rRNA pseudouridine955/2504/2580 synthase
VRRPKKIGRRFPKKGNAVIERICNEQTNLKDFTDNACAQASFAWAYLLRNREIKINGKKTGGNIPLQPGDRVQYFLTKKQEEMPSHYPVYEDENIYIADKESGVNSEAVFCELNAKGGGRYAFIHRLDRNTRGLLVFGKTEKAEEELLCAFREKRVEKRYHALCFGDLKTPAAVLMAYLKKDEKSALVKVFSSPQMGAEKIITEYSLLTRENGVNKVEIVLHTGKTHQIRAHFAHIGCPIVGDMKYGNSQENKRLNCARQALVAKRLCFFLQGELAYVNGKEFVSRFEV